MPRPGRTPSSLGHETDILVIKELRPTHRKAGLESRNKQTHEDLGEVIFSGVGVKTH